MSEHVNQSAQTGQPQVEYRDIPGLPGYRAGTDGSIWSNRRKAEWKKLALYQTRKGYMRLTVNVEGKKVCHDVHRLILLTFCGPCPTGFDACHYPDQTPSNNAISNLRWDTRSENRRDTFRSKISYSKKPGHKTCRVCKQEKRHEEFNKSINRRDGLAGICRSCDSNQYAAWYHRTKKKPESVVA